MHFKNLSFALLAGASLTISFAPANFCLFSYVSVISLIFLYHQSIQAKTCYSGLVGLFWGIGSFATQVSWVFVSIYRYGGSNLGCSILITGLFILFLAIFPATHLIIMRKLQLTNPKEYKFILGFAASWGLLEIFRGWFLTGFPWGFLGYTQLNSSLRYYASYVGVFGVSFIVVIIAGLLAKATLIVTNNFTDNKLLAKPAFLKILKQLLQAICAKEFRRILKFISVNEFSRIILLIMGIFFLSLGCNYLDQRYIDNYFDNKTNANTLRSPQVAIIQANIKPDDKFLQGSIDALILKIKELYVEPTIRLAKDFNSINNRSNLNKLDLIIWPENSFPLPQNHPISQVFLQQLDQLAKKYNVGLLLGMPIAVKDSSFYNSVVALGQSKGYYHKINLVPFGDYVPLSKWLRGVINFFDLPLSNFIPGSNNQPAIILNTDGNNYKILATICYDIAYASNLRDRILQSDPDLIVAISEDGWFGDSLGPHQHLALARFRALENGRYVIRATTTGISAVIDYRGNILMQSPMLQSANLISKYEYRSKATVWNKIGNYPIIGFLLGFLILSGLSVNLHNFKLFFRKNLELVISNFKFLLAIIDITKNLFKSIWR